MDDDDKFSTKFYLDSTVDLAASSESSTSSDDDDFPADSDLMYDSSLVKVRTRRISDNGLRGIACKPITSDIHKTHAVIAFPDVFGIRAGNIGIFAGLLAQMTKMRVIVPDVLHGKAWPIEDWPPKDLIAFKEWKSSVSHWDVIVEDIKDVYDHLVNDGYRYDGSISFLGFGWGAGQALRACCQNTYANRLGILNCGCICIDPCYIEPGDMEDVIAKGLFLTHMDEEMLYDVKRIFGKTSYGKETKYHCFKEEPRGFVCGKFDWSVPHTKRAIWSSLKMTTKFIKADVPKV